MVNDTKRKRMILNIVERIKEGYRPEKIILYGSFAYGQPSEESDIDLFIVKKTNKKRLERFCEVRKLIRDIRGVSIQPVVFTPQEIIHCLKMNDDFVRNILEKGEKLYG